MKVVALAALAVAVAGPAFAADLSSPPPAGDPIYAPAPMAIVGHLELGLGIVKSDYSSDAIGIFDGAGRVNIPLHTDWNLQVDLNATASFQSGGSSYAATGPALHLWHQGSQGAIGVFGGATFGGGTTGFIGAEGKIDITPATTLGAQAAFGAGSYGYNYWIVRGWAEHYFTPDTKLRGEVGFADDNNDSSVWNLTAELEHRFTGSQFSAFGKVGYSSTTSGLDSNSWMGLVGLRIFLDPAGTTLRDHDHMVPWDVAGLRSASPS